MYGRLRLYSVKFLGSVALGFGGDFAHNPIENPRVLGSIPRPATSQIQAKAQPSRWAFCFFSGRYLSFSSGSHCVLLRPIACSSVISGEDIELGRKLTHV